MKKLLIFSFLFLLFINVSAQKLDYIPGPEDTGTNSTADDRTLLPFFKDGSYIYCMTYKMISSNPVVRRGFIVRVNIKDGGQFVYPDAYLTANGGTDAKKANDLIVFKVNRNIVKLDTKTGKVSVLAGDVANIEIFDHYVFYETETTTGVYCLDLNTGLQTQLITPNNRKLYRIGAVYYDKGVLYLRSQYIITGVHYGIYRYDTATKKLTELVGADVRSDEERYQYRDESVKVNDNVVFLMKDSDVKLKFFSINLSSQTLNSDFTFSSESIFDISGDLMVFNNKVYITQYDKVYTSDGAAAPVLSTFPPFTSFGDAGRFGDVKYLNNEAYLQLSTSEYGFEFWKYDGTERDKQLIKDITPGREDSFSENNNGFVNRESLYFVVNRGPKAYSLYVTDGTEKGTVGLVENFIYMNFSILFFDNQTVYFYGQNQTSKGLFAYTPHLAEFDQPAPVCVGGALAALPKVSSNGITGSWSPALDNTKTTEYTFTPTEGQSVGKTYLTIEVNPILTPIFAQIAPICSGGTLQPLPTTSTNGISGKWSPALDNTNTIEYTFTPTAVSGQCYTSAVMTITVNDKITPIFNQVGAICKGAALSALPKTSNNGISGTWSPILNSTATTTYTFTPSTGQCAGNATMTITVNEKAKPIFEQVGPICYGDNLSPLPTTSINGISGTWFPALDNRYSRNYTFTPADGQCGTTAKMLIVVNNKRTPTFDLLAPICSGGVLQDLPTTSRNGISGTWSPALDNMNTTEYTFTPSEGQCANTYSTTITVYPIPEAPVALQQQKLAAGSTVGNIAVKGTNVKYYSSETSNAELASDTVLSEGVYFASQTANRCESQRIPITVTLQTLGIKDMDRNKFSVMAFPNPFKSFFSLKTDIESPEAIEILIYDMSGKLIETKKTSPSEVANYKFGQHYPSGIYSLIVNQSGKRIFASQVIKK